MKGNQLGAPKYRSYLIRLWQEDAREEAHQDAQEYSTESRWRFVLVDLGQGEQRGFASIERLFAFLKEQVDDLSTNHSL